MNGIALSPVRYPQPSQLAEEIRDKICNGIGPARGHSWASFLFWTLAWLPLGVAWALGLQDAFKEAGKIHDLLYFMGGEWTHKRDADGIFLGRLIDSVSGWGIVFRPFGWALALFYFCLVASCGFGSFSFRDEPLTLEQVPEYVLKEVA